MSNRFRYFNSSPEIIRLVVMMYVRYPLSLRNVADLLHRTQTNSCDAHQARRHRDGSDQQVRWLNP
jgi:putative transposase